MDGSQDGGVDLITTTTLTEDETSVYPPNNSVEQNLVISNTLTEDGSSVYPPNNSVNQNLDELELPNNKQSQDSWLSKIAPTHLFTPVVLSILVTETAERFAYFGFRAVLVLFFTTDLLLDENTAISCFAYNTCLASFSCLFGALLAESSLGRFRTILCCGSFYAVGLMILTWAALLGDHVLFWKRALTLIGLILISFGTGGIKPCVNIFGADQVALRDRDTLSPSSKNDNNNNNEQEKAMVGSHGEHEEEEIIGRTATTQTVLELPQAEEGDDHAVREFFNFFYFCNNVGAVSSYILIPIVKRDFGFGVAFLLPTIFMVFALVLFFSRRKEYIHSDQKYDSTTTTEGSSGSHQGSSHLASTFRICFRLVRQKIRWTSTAAGSPPQHHLVSQQDGSEAELVERTKTTDSSQEMFQDEPDQSPSSPSWAQNQMALEDAHQALQILPIMAMLPMFWMLYDQQGSVWTLQASRMALYSLEPEQLNLLNPLEIMFFIPLFDRIIYPAMEARQWNIAPLRRMGWGMVLASISFVVSGLLERVIEHSPSESVNVFWQIPQITILTVGEIFLSVTGLEYAYSKSPDRLKGFIMATYLLAVAFGDLFGGLLYGSVFRQMDRAVAMYVCAFFMLLNRFVFGHVVEATQQGSAVTTSSDDAAALGSVDGVAGSSEPYLDYSDSLASPAMATSSLSTSNFTDGSIEMTRAAKHDEGIREVKASSLGCKGVDDDWMSVDEPKVEII